MSGYAPHPHIPPHMQQQAGGYMAPQQYRPRGQYVQANGGTSRFQQYQKREYQPQNGQIGGGQYNKQLMDQNSQQDANSLAAQQQQISVAANIAAAVAAAGGQQVNIPIGMLAAAAGNPYATGQFGPPPTAYYAAHPHQFAAAPNGGVAANASGANQGAN
ncbi:hypothetical protein EVAR_72966_1 [Eumeta japonica]|uniref:Uncharacterized protein n=1 Tax=Eumeta variegata TaxID=151549 RepID=A0A4C1TIM2_EUMVA|nr:hypothetical protein EVAR_72966_1 [Eumeta japonica]